MITTDQACGSVRMLTRQAVMKGHTHIATDSLMVTSVNATGHYASAPIAIGL